MASDTEGRDPESSAKLNVSPGGRATRGPNPDPGGDIDAGGPVPPYDERTGARGEDEISQDLSGTVGRQLDETGEVHPGQTTSPGFENPVSPQEVGASGADSPEMVGAAGAGGSPSAAGEEMVPEEGKEGGRQDTGTQGQTERPTGTSDMRDSTGIDPH